MSKANVPEVHPRNQKPKHPAIEYIGNPGGPYVEARYCKADPDFELVADTTSFAAFVEANSHIEGQPKTEKEAMDLELRTSDLVRTFRENSDAFRKEEGSDAKLACLVKETKIAHASNVTAMIKGNIGCAATAHMTGVMLRKTRNYYEHDLEMKGWIKFAEETFKEISKSSRENYVNVASVPSVEKHYVLGVERLAEFGSYLNSLDSEAKAALGPDPITELANKKGVNLEEPLAKNMPAVDALTANYKLEKRDIPVSWEVLHDFYTAGLKLTGVDTKHMNDLVKDGKKQEDLDAYLEALIDNNGDRKTLLNLEPQAKKQAQATNIDNQMLELTKTVDNLLGQKKIKGRMDTSVLDALIDKLTSLKKKAG